jgi:hypothetical protein
VTFAVSRIRCSRLNDIRNNGQDERLELVLVDKGVSKNAAYAMTKEHDLEVETTHAQLGKSRHMAKSFENTPESATAWLQLACVAMLLNAIE